ncbi:MAG: efflux RND transporter periplasmic adaptor subunit [Chitinivibrionales bacterium]|nr:efflux RND transporter periplasmic adaptor subunit [Chitinivibrionales bacterium]
MKYVVGIIGVLLILTAGCSRKKDLSQKETDPIRMSVAVARVENRTLYKKRSFSGVLEAYKKADLAPLQPGRVKRIPFQIGDYVRRGQTLVVMNDAGLVAAVARFQPLKKQYERSQNLFANKAISKAEYEKIEAEYLAVKRTVDNLEENTTIKAPFSGLVTSVAVEEGELYSPGVSGLPGAPSGLVQITQLHPLKLDLDLDETTVSKVEKGMNVELSTDVLLDTTITGTILWVNPLANSSSHTFQVRLTVPNKKQLLKAGYFMEAHIVIDKKDYVLAVPKNAVIDNKLFVVSDSVALSREVQIGWIGDTYVEIVSGVSENDQVVVSGNRALPDSAIVKVVGSK